MKTRISILMVLASVLIYSCPSRLIASPMLVEWQDGDINPFSNWGSITAPNDGDAVGDVAASGDFDIGGGENIGTGPAGGINVDGTGRDAVEITHTGDGGNYQDVFYTTAANLVGDLSDYAGVSFDFYSSQASDSAQVSLYFQAAGGNVWYYDVGLAANGWDSYYAPFEYSFAGWFGITNVGGFYDAIGNDSVTFLADLATVSRLGVSIVYDNESEAQIYGIDDFGLTVPEPETYVVLGMALLSVAFIFRKRITVSLAEARAMMQM